MDLLGLLIAMGSDCLTVGYNLVSAVAVTLVSAVAVTSETTVATVATMTDAATITVRKNLYSTIVVLTVRYN